MTVKVVYQQTKDSHNESTIRNAVQTYFEEGFYVVKDKDGDLFRYALQFIIRISEVK